MIRYTYQLKDFRSWLNGFSRALDIPVVAGTIQIPSSMGEGTISAANINPDISYTIMNFSLQEELIFSRKRSPDFGLSLFFNQVTISDFFEIRDPSQAIRDKGPARSNIFFSSTNYDLDVTYSNNSKLKRVGIFLSPAFIGRALKKDILVDLLLYADKRLGNIDHEPITFEYRPLLDEIFSADKGSPVSHLILQNRILMLAEKFLSAFLMRIPRPGIPASPRSKEKEKDIRALRDVELLLSNDKLDKFPSIEMLSKKAMMSTTKLKTKFKQVYGMKLYEFYNRNRLEKAKEMLKTGHFSVKQVGYDIGFSNLSNFAKAFKKEFGLLPKDMLRSKQ
jgi:AraC-like DNA-binding protein